MQSPLITARFLKWSVDASNSDRIDEGTSVPQALPRCTKELDFELPPARWVARVLHCKVLKKTTVVSSVTLVMDFIFFTPNWLKKGTYKILISKKMGL
jgi:hypothetical protein